MLNLKRLAPKRLSKSQRARIALGDSAWWIPRWRAERIKDVLGRGAFADGIGARRSPLL